MPNHDPMLVIDQPALSGLAKSYRRELASSGARLGHVSALNLCIRFLGLGSPNRVAATLAERPLILTYAPGGVDAPSISIRQGIVQIARLAAHESRTRSAARASHRHTSAGSDEQVNGIFALGADVQVRRLDAEALLAASCRAGNLGIGSGEGRRAVSPPVDCLDLSPVTPFVLVAGDAAWAPLDNGGARWAEPEAMAVALVRAGGAVGAEAAMAAFDRAMLQSVLAGGPEELRLMSAAERLMGDGWIVRSMMWGDEGIARQRALGVTLAEAFETRGLASVRYPDGSLLALRVGQLVEGLRQPEAPRAIVPPLAAAGAATSPRAILLAAMGEALSLRRGYAAFRERALEEVDSFAPGVLEADGALAEAVAEIRFPDVDDEIRVAVRALLCLGDENPDVLDAERRIDAGATADEAAALLREAASALAAAASLGRPAPGADRLSGGPATCAACVNPDRCRGEEICHYTGSPMVGPDGKAWTPPDGRKADIVSWGAEIGKGRETGASDLARDGDGSAGGRDARFCLAKGGPTGRVGLHLFSEQRDGETFHTFEFGGDPEAADLLASEFEWLRGDDALNGATRFALDALSYRAINEEDGLQELAGRVQEHLMSAMPRAPKPSCGQCDGRYCEGDGFCYRLGRDLPREMFRDRRSFDLLEEAVAAVPDDVSGRGLDRVIEVARWALNETGRKMGAAPGLRR